MDFPPNITGVSFISFIFHFDDLGGYLKSNLVHVKQALYHGDTSGCLLSKEQK